MPKVKVVLFSNPEYAKRDIWTATIFSDSTIDAIAKTGASVTKELGKMGLFGSKDSPEASVKEIVRDTFKSGLAIDMHLKNLKSQGMQTKVIEEDEAVLKTVPVYRDEFGMEHAKYAKGKWSDIHKWMSGEIKESDFE